MSCRRLFPFFAAVFLLFSHSGPVFAACTFPEHPNIEILPARPWKGQDDPLKAAVVLLREYLAHAKKPKTALAVRVDLIPTGNLIASLGEKKFEAPLAFPQNLNEALLEIAEIVTREMKVPIQSKKILPFLNETGSSRAYLRYADGVLALEGEITAADAERAAASFEEAIRADYNYVPAYAGLAEAQAALWALGGPEGLKRLANGNMQKAKLLNPYRAKNREERYEWYLKTRCGEQK